MKKITGKTQCIPYDVIASQDSILTLEKFSPNSSDLSFDYELQIFKEKLKSKTEKLRALGEMRKGRIHIIGLREMRRNESFHSKYQYTPNNRLSSLKT